MGNKKNRRHPGYNQHRHVFRKRRSQKVKIQATCTHKATCKVRQLKEKNSTCAQVDGSRIINMDKLQQYIDTLSQHSAKCGGSITLVGEKKDGLASILSSSCIKCGYIIQLETSKKVKGPRGCLRWECNLAAVWGNMASGSGHTHLRDTMSVLGVPVMSKQSFTKTERSIGEWWQQHLEESMLEAGKEEKQRAEVRGDYDEGVPAITVIVDGGWSKRSHRHSYNAKSGVAIIIGMETGKILHIGVRNKYCTACSQGIPEDKHTCYRNWEESSSQMETDIILEGFLKAEQTHGVRYTRFVGDGDSSVFPTLHRAVPGWGTRIKKLECANHACKCYRSSLEKLVTENPAYKGKGGLTEKMRKRLTSAARCAIKMRSKEVDFNKAVKLLQQDLVNGPLHCFGHHEHCSPDFCTTAHQKRTSTNQETEHMSSHSDDLLDEECDGAHGKVLHGVKNVVLYTYLIHIHDIP